MTDIKKVLRGLNACLKETGNDCGWIQGDNPECPYSEKDDGCMGCMMEDAQDALIEMDTLLRWMAKLCMSGDNASTVELICRRLKDLGYIVAEGGVWRVNDG